MEDCSKIARFIPKMAQNAPRDPSRSQTAFFELPGYENPMIRKRIFELLRIEQ